MNTVTTGDFVQVRGFTFRVEATVVGIIRDVVFFREKNAEAQCTGWARISNVTVLRTRHPPRGKYRPRLARSA